MPNCFSSGFLEAEPKMGILETVIYCLVHSGLGKRVDLGGGEKANQEPSLSWRQASVWLPLGGPRAQIAPELRPTLRRGATLCPSVTWQGLLGYVSRLHKDPRGAGTGWAGDALERGQLWVVSSCRKGTLDGKEDLGGTPMASPVPSRARTALSVIWCTEQNLGWAERGLNMIGSTCGHSQKSIPISPEWKTFIFGNEDNKVKTIVRFQVMNQINVGQTHQLFQAL